MSSDFRFYQREYGGRIPISRKETSKKQAMNWEEEVVVGDIRRPKGDYLRNGNF